MVIDYFASQKDNSELSLMELSQKTAVLLLLSTSKRPSEIRNISLESYKCFPARIMFTIPTYTKTLKRLQDRKIVIRKYVGCPQVCPYKALVHYIEVTTPIHKTQKLLIVTRGDGTGIAGTTLARWTKVIMAKAGIDTNYFKPYSTRAAAVSNAAKTTGSLLQVLKMGSWKKSSTSFQFYLRKVKYFSRNNEESSVLSSLSDVPASPLRK